MILLVPQCVQNHDTQPGQTVETPVEGFFKPLAYAFILLRVDGYPTVFYGDLYGTKGEHPEPASCGGKLGDLALARHLYSYGELNDYWDNPNVIGWVRRGTWDKPDGLAIIMSNAEPGQIRMFVGLEHVDETWSDILGWSDKKVKIDKDGFGEFDTPAVSMAVYVNEKAQGRERFGRFNDQIYKDDQAAIELDQKKEEQKKEAEKAAKEEEEKNKEEGGEDKKE